MYKPAGHNSLSPYLIVDNAQVTLDFIKAVFGAEPELIHRTPDGAIGHAEARIDDTIVMVGQMPGGATGAHVHVYVPDVDASFARARDAGGKVVQEPVMKDDPTSGAALPIPRASPGGWRPPRASTTPDRHQWVGRPAGGVGWVTLLPCSELSSPASSLSSRSARCQNSSSRPSGDPASTHSA